MYLDHRSPSLALRLDDFICNATEIRGQEVFRISAKLGPEWVLQGLKVEDIEMEMPYWHRENRDHQRLLIKNSRKFVVEEYVKAEAEYLHFLQNKDSVEDPETIKLRNLLTEGLMNSNPPISAYGIERIIDRLGGKMPQVSEDLKLGYDGFKLSPYYPGVSL